jgi:hypothetical protein
MKDTLDLSADMVIRADKLCEDSKKLVQEVSETLRQLQEEKDERIRKM